MATKRTRRVDPNEAFAAIVGTPPEVPQATPSTSATEQPKAAVQTTTTLDTHPEQAAPAKKLVQKGYYLTEEQVKQLGIMAVMSGVDRSSIVRDALDAWFEAHGGGGTPV